jgi:hypothetical protein
VWEGLYNTRTVPGEAIVSMSNSHLRLWMQLSRIPSNTELPGSVPLKIRCAQLHLLSMREGRPGPASILDMQACLGLACVDCLPSHNASKREKGNDAKGVP